ncbi:hypothetical protein LINPERHAP1_LOCUS13223 [Linum perenne]
MLSLKFEKKSGLYIIISFKNEHNHEMIPEGERHFSRSVVEV